MGSPIISGFVAVLTGVLVSVLVLVPMAYRTYRREGRLDVRRLLTVAAFLVYLMALWSYTLLPLPDPLAIECRPVQLTPLQFVQDIRRDAGGPDGGAVVHVALVVMNVALFMPLGFFLRRLWRRGAGVATTTGLTLSAAVELTQGTGLWGLYSCSYRSFDIDDLLTNTTGAWAGSLLAAGLAGLWRRLFPGPDAPYGAQATIMGRRLLAMSVDLLAMLGLGAGTVILVSAWQQYGMGREATDLDWRLTERAALWVPFVLVGVLNQVTGRTIGDHVARLRLTRAHSSPPSHWRRAIRYLAGIGGYQALFLAFPANLLLIPVSLLAVLMTTDRRGLPGLVSGTRLRSDHVPRAGRSEPQSDPVEHAVGAD